MSLFLPSPNQLGCLSYIVLFIVFTFNLFLIIVFLILSLYKIRCHMRALQICGKICVFILFRTSSFPRNLFLLLTFPLLSSTAREPCYNVFLVVVAITIFSSILFHIFANFVATFLPTILSTLYRQLSSISTILILFDILFISSFIITKNCSGIYCYKSRISIISSYFLYSSSCQVFQFFVFYRLFY